MYYINYDEETGEILGIYPSSENYDDVPSPKITITDEELKLLDERMYIVQDGILTEVPSDDEASSPSDDEDNGLNSNETVSVKALQVKYAKRFEKLKAAYIGAMIMDEVYTAETIKGDYNALLNDFTHKAIDIEEGNNPISVPNYCEMCGTQIVDGVCPNCRWRL